MVSLGQAAPPVLESELLSLMWFFTFISLVTSMFPFKRLRAVWTSFVKHLFNSLYHFSAKLFDFSDWFAGALSIFWICFCCIC